MSVPDMQTIFGVLPSTGGTLKVEGQAMEKNTIHRAMRHKLAMIAANRKENSILPDFTLLENNYVSEHTLSRKKPLIHKKLEITYQEQQKRKEVKENEHRRRSR